MQQDSETQKHISNAAKFYTHFRVKNDENFLPAISSGKSSWFPLCRRVFLNVFFLHNQRHIQTSNLFYKHRDFHHAEMLFCARKNFCFFRNCQNGATECATDIKTPLVAAVIDTSISIDFFSAFTDLIITIRQKANILSAFAARAASYRY